MIACMVMVWGRRAESSTGVGVVVRHELSVVWVMMCYSAKQARCETDAACSRRVFLFCFVMMMGLYD